MTEGDKFFCPRLVDYIVIVGSRHPNYNNNVAQTPELLRRYPLEDHQDFPLSPDIIFFCQPEGCISVGPKRMSLRETTSFVFTLTEKDSGKVRYGICVNFFRPIERKSDKSGRVYSTSVADGNGNLNVCPDNERQKSPRSSRKQKTSCRVRNNTLTSLCLVSHHPFFSTFRECLFILRRLIDACHDRSSTKRIGGSRNLSRDTVWGVLTGQGSDNLTGLVMHEVKEIETWILRLLSAPVCVPGKTRVEVQVLSKELQAPLLFALPDHTRFSLVDFPLHLPLELLGVDTCLKVLTAIMLEYKVVMQSRDYNALSMSVMAFVSMLYPLEYMFPVIPLLPTCMSSAEQLLMAPTPFIIGVPASFFPYKNDFKVPDDVWIVDLDSNKMTIGRNEELPPLPEPEGTHLRNHLKQALASMSMTPQPIKNLDALAQNPDQWKRRESFSSQTGFNPLIYGNDVDSVDVATRVAMIRFYNSANTLGNFSEHTRTLRLYPRPVVAFQVYSFLKSRPVRTHFTSRLARTQAVEFYAEWSLCPKNVVFLRVQTSVYDPLLIGDKPKWYAHQLQPIEFRVYDENSSLGAALNTVVDVHSDDYPTDESGSDSDGADSTSSSYSSLSDFVTDMVNSEIDGDTPAFLPENQVLLADEAKVYSPPDKLQLPETPVTTSDSAFSIPDSDASSSDSDSPSYSSNPPRCESTDRDVTDGPPKIDSKVSHNVFKYDSGNAPPTSKPTPSTHFSRTDSVGSNNSTPELPKRPALAPLTQSLNSAFEAYEKPIKPPYSPKRTDKLSASDTSGFHSLSLPPSSPRKLSTSTHSSPGIKSYTDDNISDRASTPSSLISTISNELTDIAQSASSTVSELFGSDEEDLIEQRSDPGSTRSPHPSSSKPAKPFAPLGNRKALVEKSGLVKHAATNKKHKESHKHSQESRQASNSENQQFLKEVVTNVLEGQGVSWLKLGRIRKLMEDENYRNFIVSRLNKNLDKKLADDTPHIEDISLSKPVYKGMMTLVKALVHGLEHTYLNHGLGGMASAYMLLEIVHTHYWAKEVPAGTGSNKSDSSHTPEITSPCGSHENLSVKSVDSPQKSETRSLNEDQMVASLGSPVIVNGEEFENIEIKSFNAMTLQDPNSRLEGRMDQNENLAGHRCDVIVSDTDLASPTTQLDVMRQMVKNKEMMTPKIDKRCSIESEMSEASTLISSSSENFGEDEAQRKKRIKHQNIRGAMSDSEMEMSGFTAYSKRSKSGGLYGSKSSLSTGYRYNDGKMISTSPQPHSPEGPKLYLFEGLTGKDRTRLWDQMQFWEDVYLDAVAQERDIIGMDQGPGEMMDRYISLGNGERRRLEHDEDKLLAYMLYNIVAFMIMMRVNKQEVRKKIRRLLGKSHIGLAYSADVNNLLDQINNLHGNDIDLRPMGSRFMQKQSFTVHWGGDNTGDMLFMEVCDDCIILRSVTGAICDRWWYEKLVNMTYCPKTKVLCLWRKHGEKVQLNQFYTKKCRELYFCVKESMEKAASRNNGKLPGPELGGEFPVTDMKSGQGGLLQVCMEGIGLLLANSKVSEVADKVNNQVSEVAGKVNTQVSEVAGKVNTQVFEVAGKVKLFIELGRIKKCFTQKGGIFVLEEFDSKTKKVTQHKFKSRMADQICYAVLCVFSYIAAGMEQQAMQRRQT